MTKLSRALYGMPTVILIATSTLNGLLYLGTNRPSLAAGGTFSDLKKLALLGFAYMLAAFLSLKHWQVLMSALGSSKAMLLFILYAGCSMFWSGLPLKVFVNFGHYTGMFLCAFLLVFYHADRPDRILIIISRTVSFSVIISLLAVLLLPAESKHWYTGRWQGLAGNPNTLGLVCVVSVWSNIALLLLKRKFFAVELPYLLFTIVVLVGAKSMTSILLSIGMAGTLIGLKLIESDPVATKLVKLISSGVFCMGMLVVVFIAKPELFTIGGALGSIGKDATLTGRTDLWTMAGEAFSARPVLGWSFDSGASAFAFLGERGVGQFHNGYLDLLVRGGGVGLIIVLFIMIDMIVVYMRAGRQSYIENSIFATLFAGLAVHNITEASLAREGHLLWLLFLVVYFHSRVTKKRGVVR